MKKMKTGGEALVHGLLSHGIDTIFGLPGVQNDYFYTAVYDARDRMRLIHTRHEQGAAYMALGYALASGKTGVYVVVPGPGFLNTTAAPLTAYATNAPVLCLTGQIHSGPDRPRLRHASRNPDQLGMMSALTKWARAPKAPPRYPAACRGAERNALRPAPARWLGGTVKRPFGQAELDDSPIPLGLEPPRCRRRRCRRSGSATE